MIDGLRTSENCATLMGILAEIQNDIDPVIKNKTVKVEGDKASWSSAYATLGRLAKAIEPHLKAHRIAKIQGCGVAPGLGPVLITRLQLGAEWLEADYPIKESRPGAQGFGGGISFAKRWAICGIFDIVPDDVEEGQGYKDARAEIRPPRRAAAPAGLAAVLDSIRTATSAERFEAAARAARAAHPSGEQANAVEGVITARMVASIDAATSADKLTELHDLNARLLPKGGEVRQAFQRAEQRIGVGR